MLPPQSAPWWAALAATARGMADSHGRFLVILLVCAYGIILLRCAPLFVAPTLRVEDGSHVFAYFYSHREWESLWRFKSGYLPLIPNVLGFISVRLPLQLSPYFLTIVPSFLALAGFVAFFAKTFRWVGSDRVRFVACLAMVAVPVGQFHLICHTDFSIWSALLLCCLLALVGQVRAYSFLPLTLVSQAVIWSNPLSIVAAPAHAAQLVPRLRHAFQLDVIAPSTSLPSKAFHCLALVGQAAHLRWGVERDQSGTVATQLQSLSWIVQQLERAWHHVAVVLFRTLFGPYAEREVMAESPYVVHGFAALALLLGAALGCHPLRGRARALLAISTYFVVAITFAIVASKSDAALRGGWPRYHYVQSLFAVLFYCGVVVRLGQLFAPLAAHGRRHLVVAVIAGMLVTNAYNAGPYREKVPENAVAVRSCMQRLERLERRHGGPCGFTLKCRKQSDFNIAIRAQPCTD